VSTVVAPFQIDRKFDEELDRHWTTNTSLVPIAMIAGVPVPGVLRFPIAITVTSLVVCGNAAGFAQMILSVVVPNVRPGPTVSMEGRIARI
jgi:hypothetical protein